MSQIALDIVLLPPSDIMDQAIAINKQFPNDPIQLNKTDCLPHISLCMGVAQEEDLAKIEEIINETIREFSPLSLTIENINKQYSSFYIKHNKQLQKLHEKIMENLAAYLSYDANTTMFYSPPTVVEKTLYWVTTYKETSSRDKFNPHITLGISKLENKGLSINFTASQIAVCHLGNYCTCRKILYTTNLK